MRAGKWQVAGCGAVVVMVVFLVSTCRLYSQPINTVTCEAKTAQLRDTLLGDLRKEARLKDSSHDHLPIIYVITPTYRRPEQIADLTRLAQTLMHVPRLHWILAEDTNTSNMKAVKLLERTGLPHTYLMTPMPKKHRNKTLKPKGVANRNGGLEWVRSRTDEGVVFFADDDNTYDLRLFEEMRYTKRVSMWPVGLIKHSGVSTPVLRDGHFLGWFDGWIGGRKFPVDMAGFAVSVRFLLERPKAHMPFSPGHEEDGFLRSLDLHPSDIEFKAAQCTQLYVWHTQTKRNQPYKREILSAQYDNTNLRILQEDIDLQPG